MEIEQEITPTKQSLAVGTFELNLLPQSVTDEVKARFTLGLDDKQCPDDYVQASVTLKCDPPIKFRKSVHMRIPTWFSTERDVEVGIFVLKDDMAWREAETTALTDEKFIDVHVKELSNVTAFLRKTYLQDVSLKVKPYLFHNSSGTFKVGAMPSDEVVATVLSSDMKSKNHSSVVKEVKDLSVLAGDEVRYSLSDQQLKGKVIIDEGFLQEFIGQAATYDLKASPFPTSFDLQHVRVENGRSETVRTEEYPVVLQESQGPDVSNIEFLGKFEADNVINNAADVYIDQTTKVDKSGKVPTESSRNEVRYGSVGRITHATRFPGTNSGASAVFSLHSTGAGNRASNLKFFGDVKVKNVIGNAKNVTIDQRRIQTQPNQAGRNDNLPTRVAVQAEGDMKAPKGSHNVSNGDQYDIDISTKNDIESMVGSERTFVTTSQSEGHLGSKQVKQ